MATNHMQEQQTTASSDALESLRKASNRLDVERINGVEDGIRAWLQGTITKQYSTASESLMDKLSELRGEPVSHIAKVLARLACTHAVVQRTVLDPDFFDEYVTYYSRQFQKVPSDCTRVHFFALEQETPTEVDPVDFIDAAADAIKDGKGTYIGFVTLRPLVTSPIAASILSPPKDVGWITVSGDFPVHIAGREFQVHGTPFMQQDSAVIACGQASIWMSLRTIRRRDGHRAYSPGQISSAAFKGIVSGRTLPNRGEGVTLLHILEAIRTAGYSTPVLELEPATSGEAANEANRLFEAKLKIYRYVEANIPVILILKTAKPGISHAVVVVGHGEVCKYKELKACPAAFVGAIRIKHHSGGGSEKEVKIIPSAFFCDSFVIQNDAEGPYQLLPSKAPSFDTAGSLCSKNYSLDMATHAIPVLPADVFMDADEASTVARKLLTVLFPAVTDFFSKTDYIVERPYLMDKHDFRSWAIRSQLSPTVTKIYRALALPKRLWVIELSCKHEDDSISTSFRRLGEIVIDATGDPALVPYVFAHFLIAPLAADNTKGVVFVKDPRQGAYGVKCYTDDEQDYSILERPLP